MHNIKFLLPIFLLISCQPPAEINKYLPPSNEDQFQSNITIKKGFNDLWMTLVMDLSESFKLSSKDINLGEIIFNFDTEEADKYINCGMMNDEIYVNYIDRIFESSLDANIHLQLEAINENETKVNVTVKYKFISKETGTRWSFKTNKSKSILVGNPAYGADPYRECKSKNFLEAAVIKKISAVE